MVRRDAAGSEHQESRDMMDGMKAVQPRLTYAEFCLMPDGGKRHELIDGEVFVTPSPGEKHQRVLASLLVGIHVHSRHFKAR